MIRLRDHCLSCGQSREAMAEAMAYLHAITRSDYRTRASELAKEAIAKVAQIKQKIEATR